MNQPTRTQGSSPPIERVGPGPENDAQFRLLVDSVADYAIFMLDVHGRVATWNLGAQRIKGYSAVEILGHHFSEFYPPADVATGKCERELEIADHVGRFEEEGWRIRKDGSRFWANVIITAVRDPSSRQLRGYAKVTRDLTERKRAEEQREELIKAQETVRMRDEFISIASHELKTPLSTLRLQVDLLMRGLNERRLSWERVVRGIEVVRSQINRLDNLVTVLLDVTRIEAGQLKLAREEVDLVDLVHGAFEPLEAQFANVGCVLSLTANEPVVGIWDGNRLDQVVTNLLTNAAKYGAGKPVHVSVYSEEATAVLSVTDQGIGVAPEHQARIFERFERVADARHFGGFGLGLWLTKKIVEQHGGSISVSSVLGAGATFTVRLPRRANA